MLKLSNFSFKVEVQFCDLFVRKPIKFQWILIQLNISKFWDRPIKFLVINDFNNNQEKAEKRRRRLLSKDEYTLTSFQS